jgi:pseudouridine-5'-monophosphatase
MGSPAACLFDLDGVLLDTEPLQARAWREAASHFGCELDASQLRRLRGRRRPDCAEQVCLWIRSATGSSPGSDALLAVRQPLADQLLPGARPMPGAEALVHSCAERGIPMALATSSARRAVERKAAPHPWLQLINVQVYGDDPALGGGKPSPEPFLLAATRLGTAPQDCWAFEDSQAGIEAAFRAGCQVYALVPDPSAAADLQVPKGVTVVRSLEDVAL